MKFLLNCASVVAAWMYAALICWGFLMVADCNLGFDGARVCALWALAAATLVVVLQSAGAKAWLAGLLVGVFLHHFHMVILSNMQSAEVLRTAVPAEKAFIVAALAIMWMLASIAASGAYRKARGMLSQRIDCETVVAFVNAALVKLVVALIVMAAAVVLGCKAGGWGMGLVVAGTGGLAMAFAKSQAGVSVADGFGPWLLAGIFGGLGIAVAVTAVAGPHDDGTGFLGGGGAAMLAGLAGSAAGDYLAAFLSSRKCNNAVSQPRVDDSWRYNMR